MRLLPFRYWLTAANMQRLTDHGERVKRTYPGLRRTKDRDPAAEFETMDAWRTDATRKVKP